MQKTHRQGWIHRCRCCPRPLQTPMGSGSDRAVRLRTRTHPPPPAGCRSAPRTNQRIWAWLGVSPPSRVFDRADGQEQSDQKQQHHHPLPDPAEASLITAALSVNCLARARSIADTSRKISRGIAPTQRGWRHQDAGSRGCQTSLMGRLGADGSTLVAQQEDRRVVRRSKPSQRSPIRANLKATAGPRRTGSASG